jgi:hypothetical protein
MRLLGLLVALCLCAPVTAAELGRGALPLHLAGSQLAPMREADELMLRGHVDAKQAVTVVVRVDDLASNDYASRANIERELPPGDFTWRINLQGLRASNGRAMQASDIRQLIIFAAKSASGVEITRLAALEARELPAGAKGYAFGPEDAPLPAGFTRVGPDSPLIAGGAPVAIARPAPDPLIASGLRGVARLRLPWPEGRARVTIWAEDPGAWELLPHPLKQRITVNGREVRARDWTADEWIRRRYLRGLAREHGPADDAWSAFGQWRGARVSTEVEVGSNGVEIALAGDGPAARFINAVVIEPAWQRAGFDAVRARRAEWYRSHWPVVAPKETVDAIDLAADGMHMLAPRRLTIAPGTGTRITLAVRAHATARPRIELDAPRADGTALPANLWAGQWRLTRKGAADTVLRLTDDLLRADVEALPLETERARRYEIWLQGPENAPPGTYRGALTVRADGGALRLPIIAEVPDLRLPKHDRAGFYLDEAPHWTWFRDTGQRARQIACDLDFLASMGIRGNAPALATPMPPDFPAFLDDMRAAKRAGTAAPWLGYAPLKRLIAREGRAAPQVLAALAKRLDAAGLPRPVWSLADEPGNADQSAHDFQATARQLRAAVPDIRVAGHLNAPHDAALAPLFDVILINQGFGIDKPQIAAAAQAGPRVWLYNTGRPRLSAGLWLWATGAGRYLQWHARMPTADPFDPLDGREGDVQMVYPRATPCPRQPHINRSLLEMAQGIVDGRWLAWLSRQPGRAAETLRRRIKQRLGTTWSSAARLDAAEITAIRREIIALATSQKQSARP